MRFDNAEDLIDNWRRTVSGGANGRAQLGLSGAMPSSAGSRTERRRNLKCG